MKRIHHPFARRTLVCLLIPALLAACASPPPAPPAPSAPVQAPARFKEDALWRRASATGAVATEVGEDWWRGFGDPVLDDLQRRLVIGNNNLKSAAAQVSNAQAALASAQAVRWPTLGVTGGRSTASAGNAGPATVQASAAWELDLWGRLSGGLNAAGANLQASQDDLAAARLSAQATLVQTYLALRTAEAQQALLQRSRDSFARALDLTQARQAAGVVALSDVLQAQTQLDSVLAQVDEQSTQRAQYEHAIAVLLGEAPSTFSIAPTGVLPRAPDIPPLLPSTLLERRPDIVAAERRVAAAYQQIGVADAAFFPRISLSADAGLAGRSLARLVSAPALAWSLGASVLATVLDGGQHQQASVQARAAADQATAAYRQSVLVALQEVEDNLVLVDRLDSEVAAQQRALDAAQRNLDIVQAQYRAGTVSFLNVAAAQSSALSAEGTWLSMQGRQLGATGVLLKNIGGHADAAPAPAAG